VELHAQTTPMKLLNLFFRGALVKIAGQYVVLTPTDDGGIGETPIDWRIF
jgi:hypothetical protein